MVMVASLLTMAVRRGGLNCLRQSRIL